MRSFLLLLKTNLMMTFPFLGPLRKKKKSSKALPLIAGVIFLLVFAFITLYLTLFATMFKQAGEPELILVMGISVTGLMIFFQTITKANVYLFRTKDYDMLITLPVSNKAIILSKLVNLYIYNFVVGFTILLASFISYSIVNGFYVVLLLTTIVTTIFCPMIPIAISSIFAFLIGYISLPPKTKNIISTILYLVFFIVFFIFYMKMMNQSEEDIMKQISYLKDVFKNIYPLTTLIFSSMVLKDVTSSVIFIVSSVLCISAFVLIVSRFYVSIHNVVTRTTQNKKYKLSDEQFKSSGEYKTLLKKELRLYFSIPSYVINTIPGPIISIIGTIYLAIQYSKASDMIGEMIGTNITNNTIICIVGAILVLFMSLTTTTSSSISLENKNLWILKTSPISVKNIFLSKITLNSLLTVPFIIIDLIILGIILNANLLVVLMIILTTSITCIAFYALGLYINICLPKFNYDNPIQVVKQSSSVLVNLLISFVIEIIYFVLTMVSASIGGTFVCVAVNIAVCAIIATLSFAILFTNGIKKFNKLSN